MYTQRGEGVVLGWEESPMQITTYTDKARKHTHSKPCKHNANQSISTNPLFNHVYSV